MTAFPRSGFGGATALEPSPSGRSGSARRARRGYGRRSFRATLEDQLDDPTELNEFVRRALGLFGLRPAARPGAPDAIDDLLHAVGPSLRLDMLHLGEPAISKALVLGDEMVRHRWSLARTSPDVRAVYSSFEAGSSALRLLASDPAPLRLPSLKRRRSRPSEART